VPDVVGLSVAEAFVRLQEPAEDMKAPKGSIVGINVSQGPPTTTATRAATTPQTHGTPVPSVVGMSQREAFARLEQARFRVDSFPVASSRARGLVVSQRPAGGTRASPRAVVRTSVSLGSGARPFRLVPDVTDQTGGDAKRALVQAGFTVPALEPEDETTSRGGVVNDQKPSAGARVRAGSQVVLYLGPAQ
jgi:eukaryotic-like serine/threonine-protein kinase